MSERIAQFLAWLEDGIAVKASQENTYQVLSREEARTQFEKLVDEERFDEAKEFSAGLKRGMTISDAMVVKSTRLSLPDFVSFIRAARRDQLTITEFIKRGIVVDLKRDVLDTLSRERVAMEKLELLRRTLIAWEKAEGKERSTDSYSIQMPYYPPVPDDVWNALLAQLAEHITGVGHCEGVEQVAEALVKHSSISGKELYEHAAARDLKRWSYLRQILRVQGSTFAVEFRFQVPIWLTNSEGWLNAKTESPKRVIRDDGLGDDPAVALACVLGIDLQALEAGRQSESISIDFFSRSLRISEDGTLVLGDTPLPTERASEVWNQIAESIVGETHSRVTKIKKNLDRALNENQFELVHDLTLVLASHKEKEILSRFAVEMLRILMGSRSQVVAFNIPELLLGAWEALGNRTLESLLKGEKAK